MRYDFAAIESRWQERWEKEGTFRAANPGEPGFAANRPKFYVLDMFPYPSGVGLHVGHPLGYIATDIVARYQRMRGFNVLHPIGFDAFGLPAEQFAVEHGVHPRLTTERNIANMTRQLRRLGLSYDWDRVLATTDVGYYRWTQWIFLQLYGSWFDPRVQKARPVSELEAALEAGDLALGAEGGVVVPRGAADPAPAPAGVDSRRLYRDLDPAARRAVIDDQRLAYMGEVQVNWCPALGTVLANEEVTSEGRSDRGNYPVFKRPLKQWMLRITAYAERLEQELDGVDWPESVASMQRNWIGRSEGARIDFPIEGQEGAAVRVFTTRPDTLFGATYLVLAPEHPLALALATPDRRETVRRYREQAMARSEVERQAETAAGVKSGVDTGGRARNPASGELLPVWVADYVLGGYGTGAIMAVPAGDLRDFEFARAFGLPVRPVVRNDAWLLAQAGAAGWWSEERPPSAAEMEAMFVRYLEQAADLPQGFEGEGIACRSASPQISLDGLPTAAAKKAIVAWLEASGHGRRAVQYKLRDWLFSRQRYWGEPFPILHGPDGEVVALGPDELPVELPPMDDFRPETSDDPEAPPRPPLARAPESWRFVVRDGKRYQRELNTMPQWAGSCWYYLRFLSPHDERRMVGEEAERYWMAGPDGPGAAGAAGRGVDLYVGGVEHAVLHLLYARFWHKVLHDLGHVTTREPFARLFNQGYILAHAYLDARGVYVPAEEVEERDGAFFYRGEPVRRELGKMGKSLKNAIGPDEVCERYGCDTLRLYEMSLGPLAKSKVWNTRDILGVHRFLQRLWRCYVDDSTGALRVSEDPAEPELRRLLHRTIQRVTADMESLDFNTAIAALIELVNELVGRESLPREVARSLVLLLAPLAPHVAEELWRLLGSNRSLAFEEWPGYDVTLLAVAEVTYPVQVNGKLRAQVPVPADADDAAIERAVLADERVQAFTAGKRVERVIVVRGRLVSLVAR